jgi:enamine deaminase RidA (YjgF/YER057c/UK114 family)
MTPSKFLRLSLSLIGAALLATPSRAAAPSEVSLPAEANSPIAAGVALPAGKALFCTSGTVPSAINKDGATIYERYGDTYTQGVSALKNIETVLAKQGLTLKDVVYLRVYIVPDAAKGGKVDYAGWFKAYGEFFNTAQNPRKTARSTVGVQSLVHPDWLIEIEAFAVYP